VVCEGEAAPKKCAMFCVPAACSAGPFFFGMVCCVAQKREVKIFCRADFHFFIYNTKDKKNELIFLLSLSLQETSEEHGRDNAAVRRTIFE
jgi:hypothetical protein